MPAEPPVLPPPTFPPVLSSAARDAAVEFFESYCNLKATEQSGPGNDPPCAGIMGVISFFGDSVWSFAIVLPELTAVTCAKSFSGFEIPFDSPDMGDMIGEMANVIAGGIVARLDARGVKSQMGLPTVARGHDVELLPPSNACAVKLRFQSPNGGFWFRLVKAREGLLTRRAPQ